MPGVLKVVVVRIIPVRTNPIATSSPRRISPVRDPAAWTAQGRGCPSPGLWIDSSRSRRLSPCGDIPHTTALITCKEADNEDLLPEYSSNLGTPHRAHPSGQDPPLVQRAEAPDEEQLPAKHANKKAAWLVSIPLTIHDRYGSKFGRRLLSSDFF